LLGWEVLELEAPAELVQVQQIDPAQAGGGVGGEPYGFMRLRSM
jgi:hypothetical protein